MIYSKMLKPKFRNLLRAFVLLLMAVFILSLYSCNTIYMENYSPEQLRADTVVTILNVSTKNDSIINLTDYNAKYFEQFNEVKDVIVWEKTDTVMVKTTTKTEYKLQNKYSKLNLTDVLNIKVEKERFNVLKTLLFSGLVMIANLAIFSIVFFTHDFR